MKGSDFLPRVPGNQAHSGFFWRSVLFPTLISRSCSGWCPGNRERGGVYLSSKIFGGKIWFRVRGVWRTSAQPGGCEPGDIDDLATDCFKGILREINIYSTKLKKSSFNFQVIWILNSNLWFEVIFTSLICRYLLRSESISSLGEFSYMNIFLL